MINSSAAVAYPPYVANLWAHVKSTGRPSFDFESDRAVEYCRRFALEPKVFKLINMAIGFVVSRVRVEDKEIFHVTADFSLDHRFHHKHREDRKIVLQLRIAVENPSKHRLKHPCEDTYELVLIVNADGFIVDVDFAPLLTKFQSKMAAGLPKHSH